MTIMFDYKFIKIPFIVEFSSSIRYIVTCYDCVKSDRQASFSYHNYTNISGEFLVFF